MPLFRQTFVTERPQIAGSVQSGILAIIETGQASSSTSAQAVERWSIARLHALAPNWRFLQHRPRRTGITTIKPVPQPFSKMTFCGCREPIADGNRNVLHHAVIAITIGHAPAIPDAFGLVNSMMHAYWRDVPSPECILG